MKDPERTVQVALPAMGESVREATLVAWRKQPGERVEAGEILAEVTTDKVDVEVPAQASGYLTKILVQPGQTVPVGAVLGELSPEAPLRDGPAVAAASSPTSPPTAPPNGAVVPVTLPPMGESVKEGTVAHWLRAVGDTVAAGDVLAEVTTDKVDVEVAAPAGGRLARILVPDGKTVAVGATLAEIEAAQPAVTPPPVPSTGAPPAPPPAPRPDTTSRAGATPLARRLAVRRGLDLMGVQGTGPRGQVRRRDVLATLWRQRQARPAAVPPPLPAAPPRVRKPVPTGASPLAGAGAALAAHMQRSLTIPTATSFRTVLVDILDARRRELNDAGRAAGGSEKVSFTHVIGYAVARAALDMPVMATHFAEIDGKPHRVASGIHLGLAVDVERKGGARSLIVPVIRDAAQLDFPAFRAVYESLVQRARTGKLTADELQGATLSLTNPGGIGTQASVPRLMPGQGAIIAVGAIGYPPGLAGVEQTRLRELGVGKVMTMSSTYDHRVIQGAESGEFLGRVEALLQGADGFYDEIFASLKLGAPSPAPAPPDARRAPSAAVAPGHELLAAVSAAMSLVKAHRTHGHLAARLDPLGSEPIGDPAMDPATVHLTPELMAQVPADVLRVKVPGRTLAEVLPRLRETYCSTIAYEIEHISSHEQRVWLREKIESGAYRQPLPAERRLRLLQRLTKADAMERYLRRTFIGHKTFSLEGLDVMIPILEEMVSLLAEDYGAQEIVLGMAHRGRLSVIAHVADFPYASILVDFEQSEKRNRRDVGDVAGDVKYHQGISGIYTTASGKRIGVKLLPNPSHLEAVDAVVEGWARADQTRRRGQAMDLDINRAVPVLIHGDAAFPGQGVVAEVLNLQNLAGYSTGGTLHVIANNQIGFTTDPRDARSTRYASDLAKGFDLPIIHVNADDVEASISAVDLAVAYRQTFHEDVVIDLIGYRRFGHNETDEPAYTQPLMYAAIRNHPPVREIYAARLVAQGLLTAEEARAGARDAYNYVAEAHTRVKASLAKAPSADPARPGLDDERDAPLDTRVPPELLVSLNEQLLSVPDDFTIHPKLVGQLQRRRKTLEGGEVDWAQAESLALASLLMAGVPIRFTGQDTERGTFSQRHLVFHDVVNARTWTPMQHLVGARATFELHNSPLSEYGALGFEYGYSAALPDTLVIWEAQFGDFVNNAQVVVDQFIAAGHSKWGQSSRLTLLLPHGYEGAGPEHSSARPERFLYLIAQSNMRLANCSTAAQYFHLLRQQALSPRPRPLVLLTPKSLLRLKQAAATLPDLAQGAFQPVIDDASAAGRREKIRRLILCSGKVYHDLTTRPERAQATDLAIARVELLEPFPLQEVEALVRGYPNLERLIWVQEEPRNMGAAGRVIRRTEGHLGPQLRFEYVGRPERASASEGYPGAHRAEQERILQTALGIPPASS
jgi:2-oxoglutarate dehydrogenase E1 component